MTKRSESANPKDHHKESPIVSDFGVHGSDDWIAMSASEFVGFEKGWDGPEPKPAGAPALEHGARAVRPNFFAWPYTSSAEEMPPPPPPPPFVYERDPDDAISEYQDKYTEPEDRQSVVIVHEATFDPDFLGTKSTTSIYA